MSRLMWAEIVQRYPCEWMMLAETEADDAGNIAFARVQLDHTGIVPCVTLIHTAGRPLCVTPAFRPRPRRETAR